MEVLVLILKAPLLGRLRHGMVSSLSLISAVCTDFSALTLLSAQTVFGL